VIEGMECDCMCDYCAEDECKSATCGICCDTGANRGMRQQECDEFKERDDEYYWRQKAKLRIYVLMKRVKRLNEKEKNQYNRFEIMDFED
jgi:hypothetical protein